MARIDGRVVDSHGRPVTGAVVYVESAPVAVPDIAAMADDEGRFTLAVPSAGSYQIGARSERHGRASVAVAIARADEESVVEVRLTGNETPR